MKRNQTIIFGIFMMVLMTLPCMHLQAQNEKGNKNVIEKHYNFAGFDEIEVGGAFEVIIKQAENFKVIIETDENLHDNMRLELLDDKLHIKSKGIKNFTELNVYIEMPSLTEMNVHGAAEVKIPEAFRQDEIEITASGASELKLNLITEEIEVNASGASEVDLKGQAEELYINASGATDVNSRNMKVKSAYAEASGASSVMVAATEELDINESGAADVRYEGSPQTIRKHDADAVIVKTDPEIKVKSEWNEDKERFSYESMNITVDEKGDTTEIIFGNHKIIVDDDGNVVYKKHKKKPKFNGHWAGFDLGVNGFLTPDNTMNYGPEFEYLDLNMTKSIKVGINIFEQNLNLCRNQKWGLVTGLGWEINNYRFDDNVSLVPDSSSIKGYFNDGISMKKSKLVVNYVEVPLLLEFQTNAKRKVNSFHIAAGMVFGLRFASHTKQYYNETNKEYTWLEVDPETGNKVPVPGIKFQSPGTKKSKVRDDFHLNPFKADATVRIGWGWVNLFGTYSITTLFKEGKGPELYPFSVGLTLVGL
ncbi:MAG: DUF2807 domain-containing protein [Bacteroidales bacterium]|nr:DUF2807 domain-containing protein [Bacteroidales bacterium]MCF8397401.1 DUF2807 domain-containing protein [Bacteroidales bacterium]